MGHLKPNTCGTVSLGKPHFCVWLVGWLGNTGLAIDPLGMWGPSQIMASSCRCFTSRCLNQLCGQGRFPQESSMSCPSHHSSSKAEMKK